MIRRPLWNRGGGVFVEEGGWSALGRSAAAVVTDDQRASGEGGVAVLAADEPPAGEVAALPESSPARWVHVRIVTDR